MLKEHHQYDTLVFRFRRSADSQIVLHLPLTTGAEAKLRPVEVATRNGNGCSL